MTEHEINRKEEDELDELAWRYIQGEVFIANDPEVTDTSFGFIVSAIRGEFDSQKEWDNFVDDIGAIYEEYEKASSRSINGLPFFMSASFIHKDDLDYLIDEIDEYEERINEANPTKRNE